MPHFWMRPVKPRNKYPPFMVQFEVHPQMTNRDVKQYLEKIYDIPVQYVRTALFKGEIFRSQNGDFVLRQEPDKRMAFVQLAKGETFEWPDIQAKDDGKKESNLEEQMARERKTRKIE